MGKQSTGLLDGLHPTRDMRIYLDIHCWVRWNKRKKEYDTYPVTPLPSIKYPKVLSNGDWHTLDMTVNAGRLHMIFIDHLPHKCLIWVRTYHTKTNM